MRWSLVVLSTLVVIPSLARAEPLVATTAVEDAESVAGFAKAALSTGEPGALDALMAPSVRYDLRGLTPCAGLARKGTVRGARRGKLARCVVERVRSLDDSPSYRVVRQGRADERFQVEMQVDRHELVLELRPVGRELAVVAMTFRWNERPVKVPSSWDEVDGVEGGVEGGVIGGVPAGVVGGVVAPPPPPPPPPPQPPQQIVPPTALEQQRISGDRNLLPDVVTRDAIAASGKTQLIIPLKVCIDRTGKVASVLVLKSSGFPAYDALLKTGVSKWRYRPVMVNGSAVPVCSIVQFSYRQAPPPAPPPAP